MLVLTCVYADMVLIVGGRGKRSTTALSCAEVWSFTGMSPDMNFVNVGRGEGTVTPFKWTLEGTLS